MNFYKDWALTGTVCTGSRSLLAVAIYWLTWPVDTPVVLTIVRKSKKHATLQYRTGTHRGRFEKKRGERRETASILLQSSIPVDFDDSTIATDWVSQCLQWAYYIPICIQYIHLGYSSSCRVGGGTICMICRTCSPGWIYLCCTDHLHNISLTSDLWGTHAMSWGSFTFSSIVVHYSSSILLNNTGDHSN